MSERPEPETYFGGNEDGMVVIMCRRRECMRQGDKTRWNPDGLWLVEREVTPYHPTVDEIATAFAEHIATHS